MTFCNYLREEPASLLISTLDHCKSPYLYAQMVGEEGLYSVCRDDFACQ